MPRRAKRSKGNFGKNQVMGNGSGPSRSPRVTMLKKFQYTQSLNFDSASTQYSYLTEYMRPDITKAVGAQAQFAAYELWRIKRLRVSVQNSAQPFTAESQAGLNNVSNTTIWTAADYGANEAYSGPEIMQYQNAKKNTLSLNKFVNVVDTNCRVNASLGSNQTFNFVLPASTWINTTNFDSSFYSGYQLYAMNYGAQSYGPDDQPSLTVVTELIVEFLQPGFQNTPSSFATHAFEIKLVTQPNSSDPTELRSYVFEWYKVETDSSGNRVFNIHLKREDGQPGSLTYTAAELIEAIRSGTSGKYFDARPAQYDGPMPPSKVPEVDYVFGEVPV